MTKEPLDRVWVSVGAAVYDNESDRFLLIQRRDNGNWELPGGIVESGERLEDVAVREVFEETGAHIEVLRPSGIYESPGYCVVSIVFLCRYLRGKLSTSSESSSVKWVDALEVPSLVNEAYACRLLDSLKSDVKVTTTDEISIVGSSPGHSVLSE